MAIKKNHYLPEHSLTISSLSNLNRIRQYVPGSKGGKKIHQPRAIFFFNLNNHLKFTLSKSAGPELFTFEIAFFSVVGKFIVSHDPLRTETEVYYHT